MANIKRVDCALLPPSRRTLEKKLQRAHYVAVKWTNADTASPDQGLSPTDYGWSTDGNLLKPTWFDGPAVPDSLFASKDSENAEGDSDSDEKDVEDFETSDLEELSDYNLFDDEPWSEDSDGSDLEETE